MEVRSKYDNQAVSIAHKNTTALILISNVMIELLV